MKHTKHQSLSAPVSVSGKLHPLNNVNVLKWFEGRRPYTDSPVRRIPLRVTEVQLYTGATPSEVLHAEWFKAVQKLPAGNTVSGSVTRDIWRASAFIKGPKRVPIEGDTGWILVLGEPEGLKFHDRPNARIGGYGEDSRALWDTDYLTSSAPILAAIKVEAI